MHQPTETVARLNPFYRLAASTVFNLDGTLDKMVGEQVMAFFWRSLSSRRPCLADGQGGGFRIPFAEELTLELKGKETPLVAHVLRGDGLWGLQVLR